MSFFLFEIIINFFASSFRFIWISMLWVCNIRNIFAHNIFALLSSESDVYRRQILTTKVHPRAVRVNSYQFIVSYCFCFCHCSRCVCRWWGGHMSVLGSVGHWFLLHSHQLSARSSCLWGSCDPVSLCILSTGQKFNIGFLQFYNSTMDLWWKLGRETDISVLQGKRSLQTKPNRGWPITTYE